jgi:hypothetical protein
VLEGIATRMPAPMLTLGKKVYTQSSRATVIQSRIELASAIDKAKASWVEAVQQKSSVRVWGRGGSL